MYSRCIFIYHVHSYMSYILVSRQIWAWFETLTLKRTREISRSFYLDNQEKSLCLLSCYLLSAETIEISFVIFLSCGQAPSLEHFVSPSVSWLNDWAVKRSWNTSCVVWDPLLVEEKPGKLPRSSCWHCDRWNSGETPVHVAFFRCMCSFATCPQKSDSCSEVVNGLHAWCIQSDSRVKLFSMIIEIDTFIKLIINW